MTLYGANTALYQSSIGKINDDLFICFFVETKKYRRSCTT